MTVNVVLVNDALWWFLIVADGRNPTITTYTKTYEFHGIFFHTLVEVCSLSYPMTYNLYQFIPLVTRWWQLKHFLVSPRSLWRRWSSNFTCFTHLFHHENWWNSTTNPVLQANLPRPNLPTADVPRPINIASLWWMSLRSRVLRLHKNWMCSVHRPKSQDIELFWRRLEIWIKLDVIGERRYMFFFRVGWAPGLGFKLGSMVIGSIC